MDFWKKLLNSLNKLYFVRFLVSPPVAAFLIALVTFFSFLGMVIPQKFIYPPEYMEKWSQDFPALSRFAELTGLTNLFYTWWFLLLLLLVFLSLFLCTVLRLKPVEKKSFKAGPFQKILNLKRKPNIEEVKSFFSRRFYRVRIQKEGGKLFSVYAWRFGTRFFSIMFHFGIMVVLLATFADKSSGLNGTILLTEGETFTEKHFDYQTLVEAPFFYENHQFFQVSLERFDVYYNGDVLTDAQARVRVIDENFQKEELVKVNYPLSYRGFSFLIEKIGFSPLINISNDKGETFFSSYVSLGKEKKQGFIDFLRLGDFYLNLELYPNSSNPSRLYLPENPQLKIKIKKHNKVVWQGRLSLGEAFKTPVGIISFADLRYWVLFQVAYNPLLPWIFFGFFLAVLGLTVRLLFYPLSIQLSIKAKGRRWEVALGGKTRLGRVIMERELKKIEDYLRNSYN